MWTRWGLAALLLLGFACGADSDDLGVFGSPSDVTTEAGAYEGYTVSDECQVGSADFGIKGTGAVAYTVPEGFPLPAGAGPEYALATQICDQLGANDIRVTSCGGPGVGCDDPIAAVISIDDWRNVDAALVIIGRFLAERDLMNEVTLSVESFVRFFSTAAS